MPAIDSVVISAGQALGRARRGIVSVVNPNMAAVNPPSSGKKMKTQKPVLVSKLDACTDTVNMACFVPHEDAVITVSNDKSVRVWVKRDSGQYWPSICHYMSATCTALDYHGGDKKMFVGLGSGTVAEFNLTEDLNRLAHIRNYLAHMKTVKAVVYSSEHSWILSCSNDKYFQYHDTNSGQRLGGYNAESWCTCLQFDSSSSYVFLGDYSGKISVLKLSDTGLSVITSLVGHSGSVQCLTWDPDEKWLFSGSYDQSIIIWDIGGQQGTALELQGHKDKVRGLCYAAHKGKLFSSGDDEILVVWDMTAKRHETPNWSQSDICEKCSQPFFWNFKHMWNQKIIGVRQHHCRKCGRAVCDKCSPQSSRLPLYGFEYPVRLCSECYSTVDVDDMESLASFHDAKHRVMHMSLDLSKARLVTCGTDRVVKIWDVHSAFVGTPA